MPKEAKEVLVGLLSKSLKLEPDTITGMQESDGTWKDDAIDTILGIQKERETARNKDFDAKLSAKAATVKRETMEDLEKKVREEFGAAETEAKGIDLVREVVAAKVNATGTLTDDKVKAHPLYIQKEKEAAAAPELVKKAVNEATEKLKAESQAERDAGLALERGHAIFEELGPILPKDPTVARNQRTLLDGFIGKHRLQIVKDDDGKLKDIIPMKADGSGRLEDDLGHPVTYAELVEKGAKQFFEFTEGEKKAGAPDPNKTGGGSGGSDDKKGGTFAPKSTSEYAEAWAKIDTEITDPVERQKQWAELKEAGKKAGVVS